MEQPPVKRLNRELKYQGTILKIYEDTVEANGHGLTGILSTTTVRLRWFP